MWCLCSDASPVSGCTAVVCYQGAMRVASHTSEMNKVWCYSRKCAGFVLTVVDVIGSTEPSHSSLVIDGDGLSAELSLTQGLNQINSWEKPPANSLAPYRQKLGPVNQASEVQVFPIMVSAGWFAEVFTGALLCVGGFAPVRSVAAAGRAGLLGVRLTCLTDAWCLLKLSTFLLG